jgi:AcrR family transcriptional regulator
MNAAITLDITKGHLQWTISELARKTQIQRTLIYYHFGKEKIDILLEACHLFGKIYAGISSEQEGKFEEDDYFNGLKFARDTLKDCPSLAPFYFINRDRENEISKLIKSYHSQGLKMRSDNLNGNKTLAKAVFSFQIGLALFDGLADDELKEITSHIGQMKLYSSNK